MILAGDLGGTNCRLAIYDNALQLVKEQNFKCSEFNSFSDVLKAFVNNGSVAFSKACFGLPGPVVNGICELCNLDWPNVHAKELEEQLGVSVHLLNDVEANAYGLKTLKNTELMNLQKGNSVENGNCAVLSPGTGFGEALLVELEDRCHAIATEGGHASFAPHNNLQYELLKYIENEFSSVSYELILSGPGLERIFNFLLKTTKSAPKSWLHNDIKENGTAAAVSNAALDEKCEICMQALNMFTDILAAEASNVALKYLATGGVYIGGGIAPQIIDKIKDQRFIDIFVSKVKMNKFLKTIPIYVILNDKTALNGAAFYAQNSLN